MPSLVALWLPFGCVRMRGARTHTLTHVSVELLALLHKRHKGFNMGAAHTHTHTHTHRPTDRQTDIYTHTYACIG